MITRMAPSARQTALIEPVPYTTAEAAEILGVTRATVARWIEIGHIEALRRLPGKAGYLFAVEEVERVRRAPRPNSRQYKHRPCRCGAPACTAAANPAA